MKYIPRFIQNQKKKKKMLLKQLNLNKFKKKQKKYLRFNYMSVYQPIVMFVLAGK